jgi:hypothetical protein
VKLLLLIATLIAGTIFFLPTQKDISGTWLLDTSGKKCEGAVLRIQMEDGYFAGKLDIPEQEVYDRTVIVQLKKDKIRILLDNRETCFIEGKVSDSVLEGRSFVNGKGQPVKFFRSKK